MRGRYRGVLKLYLQYSKKIIFFIKLLKLNNEFILRGRGMKRLVALGDLKSEFAKTLTTYLSNITPLSVLGSKVVLDNSKDVSLELILSDTLEEINSADTVLMLTKNADLSKLKHISDKVAVIVDSENNLHTSYLSKFKINAVTCGLHSKDTVTFSSKTEDMVVVSLQRSLKAVDNAVIEPMEIPCKIKGEYDDYSILSFVAMLILLNMLNLNDSGFISF